MDYKCDWYAPVLAEPDTMSNITSYTLLTTAGGVQGLGVAPLFGNSTCVPNVLWQYSLIYVCL